MSDVSQGLGWWLASDGKWYPPKESEDPPAPDWWLAADGRWYPPVDRQDPPQPGWWLAADGQWYPPEADADRAADADAAGDAAADAAADVAVDTDPSVTVAETDTPGPAVATDAEATATGDDGADAGRTTPDPAPEATPTKVRPAADVRAHSGRGLRSSALRDATSMPGDVDPAAAETADRRATGKPGGGRDPSMPSPIGPHPAAASPTRWTRSAPGTRPRAPMPRRWRTPG